MKALKTWEPFLHRIVMNVLDILRPKTTEEISSDIVSHLNEFEETYLPKGFKWRKGQKETIEQIISTYVEKKYNVVICDLPTGAGKSIVALAVSFVLNKIKKTGYILTSEISLQDQYEKDVETMKLPYGSVKGVDHYLCIDNDEKHSLGTCKIRNKAPRSMWCFKDCPYISARDYASGSDTSLLNYSYWLIMQNYVNKNRDSDDAEKLPFPMRDFVICDEAHKILDIVQSHYSPKFSSNFIEKLTKLKDFFVVHKVKDHSMDVDVAESSLSAMKKSEDQDTLHGLLISIEKSLHSFLSSIEVLKDRVDLEYKNKKPPHEWREALFLSDWLKDMHCKIQDYNHIIKQTTTRNLIKNPSGDELIFNCLEEKYLMNRYFHKFTGFAVLMSATFSDVPEYMRNMNIKGAKHVKMDSMFSYDRSPIYYFPKRKMSYKEFDSNKEWLYSKINDILDKHKGENGIIHSVSYDMTLKIRDNLSNENKKRVLVYSGTDQKRSTLDVMKSTPGTVIMGPSLRTGLNFPDDFARFSVIAKVPYPSLADRFIKTKMMINPAWYSWKTCVETVQCVGRTIRHEDDYCETYILDACMGDLLRSNRKAFPEEFLQRIVVVDE